jgi:hypothetical protein
MSKRLHKINLPVSSIKPDPEGSGLLDAHQMAIYDRIIMAAMQNRPDLSAAIRELAAVPVEERYSSRLVSALGFAFGDFDSACVRFDVDTLPSAEIDRLEEQLEMRASQFCILMREVFGSTYMKILMSAAVERAVAPPDDSERGLAA